MYPVHDIDAQLLLATLIAAKRRPAELADIVAAAEFLGCPVSAPRAWADALRRATSHGLILATETTAGPTWSLSPAAQTLSQGLPKKAETAERVFLVREKLAAYTPAAPSAEVPVSEEQFNEALKTHAALAAQGGKNLLMPKPKAEPEDARRRGPGGKRPFGGGRRRG